jgi:hypothetical protein
MNIGLKSSAHILRKWINLCNSRVFHINEVDIIESRYNKSIYNIYAILPRIGWASFVVGPGRSRRFIFVVGLAHSRMGRPIREYELFAVGPEHI